MSADFIASIAAIQAPTLDPVRLPAVAGGVAGDSSFGSFVSDGLRSVSRQLAASDVDLQRLASGEAENLHQVMLRLEEARLSFQLLLQIRNRVLESYQEVMRMQV